MSEAPWKDGALRPKVKPLSEVAARFKAKRAVA